MWKLSIASDSPCGYNPMSPWPGPYLNLQAMPLIHILDCAQTPPIVHKFLNPHHEVVQTKLCEEVSAHSLSLPEKWIKIYGPQPQCEGQIIVYVISPWLSILAFTSLQYLLTYFLTTLALLRILSQSTHFYFIWHETIG